jgi:hypothetical protein
VQYRIEFVDREGNVIREMHADARNDSDAVGLVADSDWPPHAVAIRVLDLEGRTVHQGRRRSLREDEAARKAGGHVRTAKGTERGNKCRPHPFGLDPNQRRGG